MQLHDLKSKTKRKRSTQVGRGGTRGKTSGRGTKGQKARAGHKIRPEMRDFIKKLPKLRGRGTNFLKSVSAKPVAINLAKLDEAFDAGAKVTPKTVADAGLVRTVGGYVPKMKIVSDGDITKKLVISDIPVSKVAKEKIEKAGGEVKGN